MALGRASVPLLDRANGWVNVLSEARPGALWLTGAAAADSRRVGGDDLIEVATAGGVGKNVTPASIHRKNFRPLFE
jgi:hypothetical protein